MKELKNVIDCACDGKHYYMLKKEKIIDIYDENLNCIERFGPKTKYSSITYNDLDNCFYLSSLDNNILYKTKNFQTFKSINLRINHLEGIINISFCRHNKSILITTNKKVYMYHLIKKQLKIIFEIKEEVRKFNDCIEPLDCSPKIILIGAVCCGDDIYIAYRIHKVTFISKLFEGTLNDVVYETLNSINSIFVINNGIWFLLNKDCYQKFIFSGIECDCDNNNNNNGGSHFHIIDSIALIEKNVATLLSNEAANIEAIINKLESATDLIQVNTSVNETLYHVTILEYVLTEKLKTIIKENE